MRQLSFSWIVIMPDQLLTLLLTLSMGALGSVISVTREFFDTSARATEARHESISWFIFRPFLGMVMAVAVFILLKAGQLTITAASETSANLNPFLISFIAIISGLLSEHAYERIQRAGAAIFQPSEEGVPRWARGLADEMSTAQISDVDIAGFADVSPQTVQTWMSEQEPVSEQHQAIIAAALRKPAREIFTDLSPAAATSPDQGSANRE